MSDVTIHFHDRGGSPAYIHLPWLAGKRLKYYLRDPALRSYNLIGLATRSKLKDQNNHRLRLTTVLDPGAAVFVVPVRSAG